MTVTAVIPTFNRPDHTGKAVESVLSQTEPPDEICVVDDGSTDTTPQVLEAFGDAVRVVRLDGAGVSAARNAGIRASSSEWIAFLDSDDRWLPRKLETQRKALLTWPGAGCLIAYTDERWIRNGAHRNQRARHRRYSGWIYERCLPLCIISPSSAIVHRTVFDAVGFFDESLPACEDYDMWLRVSARFRVLYIPEKLIVKQAGDWPQLSAQHSLDRYRIIALRKMLDGGTLPDRLVQPTVETLREKARIYARGCRKHGRDDEAAWAEEQARRE